MSGYHDIEGPYVSACATQDARDAFFDEHISLASIAAYAMMQLCDRLGFDDASDKLAEQVEASLGDDGIPHEEHEAAQEQIDTAIGMGPDKWLAAVARTIAADERAKQRTVIKGGVVPFIVAAMERAA